MLLDHYEGMERRVLEAHIPGKGRGVRPKHKWKHTIREVFGSLKGATKLAERKNECTAVQDATL